MAQETELHTKKREFVGELLKEIANPIHRRILEAYSPSSPVNSLELELQNILIEVMKADDDKESHK